MGFKMLWLALGLCGLAVSSAESAAEGDAHAAAIKACTLAGAAATPVTAIEDGRGGSLVWLTDEDANLWLCNADAGGHVYAYSMIFDDLLAGAGVSLVEPIYIDGDGAPIPPDTDPLTMAELACQAYLDGAVGKVVGRGEDGLNADWLPGYFVFIETEGGETFLCDATPNAQVWAFAKLGEPLASG